MSAIDDLQKMVSTSADRSIALPELVTCPASTVARPIPHTDGRYRVACFDEAKLNAGNVAESLTKPTKVGYSLVTVLAVGAVGALVGVALGRLR